MRPFYGAGLFCLVLCACSTTVEQTAQQRSDNQWVCDANPTTGEWDCRQLARGAVLPLPAAAALQEAVTSQPQPALIIPAEPLSTPAPEALQTPQQIVKNIVPDTVAPPNVPAAPAPVPDKGYVVQLAALSSEAAASRYIDQQHQLPESLTWHRTYSKGRHWYVVTTNPISTHVEALAAAGRLEGADSGLATWVRSLDSLRQAIEDTP
ncbi:SPOR domain-containing protein [Porticoccus sp. W117]|uniref:SPOR domain-containing protein n=1 Tax=Porticoccus sp. W117 TaxID=3054777 RepID=UPI002599FEFE|nr:SPOR domain-containing protein [Porticoccus sp. W117]MDM3871903.1 SPOR domain-containing protein [Porticoccus sp. W117]